MADDKNRVIADLAAHVAMTYHGLVDACAAIPVTPIALAGGPVLDNIRAVQSLGRVIAIAEETALPQQQQILLLLAAIKLHAAFDSITVLRQLEYTEARATCASMMITDAQIAVTDLSDWLEQQED